MLDHIETIDELDLDEVPPTSHVVDVTNRCAPTCRAVAAARVALANAPDVDDGGFPVPEPEAA